MYSNSGQQNSGHLSLRSGNPALSSKTFENVEYVDDRVMTIDGTVNRTIISLFILLASGTFTFVYQIIAFTFIGAILGFILVIATMFKPQWSPKTVPLYSLFQGMALGGISYLFNSMYEGIVTQAIVLTAGIFFSLLLAYKSRLIKATENFKLGVAAATGGIFILYMVSFFMSMFGGGVMPIMDITNSSMISIGFSVFVVIIASLNLVLDFDFIEEAAERGVPKYMEWRATLGLLVTLVWLYLEILRLLAKLQSRR
jgi:uncharacterized YccA/Bax inhibitor family protein|tara:strand:+ start:16074 stop:16841 length:768 start_codon:yes stop_codon:yes gene_type:complete